MSRDPGQDFVSWPTITKESQQRIREHMAKAYVKTLNINAEKFPWIKAQAVDSNYSHEAYLYSTVQRMKYSFVFGRANAICVRYRASIDGASSNYAFLYSFDEQPFVHRYISTGGTYDSQDGEYRDNMMLFQNIDMFIERHPDVWEAAEKIFVDMMNAGRVKLTHEIYYPVKFRARKAYEDDLQKRRLDVKLLALTWVRDYYYVSRGIEQNHLNDKYLAMISFDGAAKAYRGISIDEDEMVIEHFQHMYERISTTDSDEAPYPRRDISREVRVGQKVFPMSIVETLRTNDISFPVWREEYFLNLTSNLVLNLIAPTFAITNGWFYIQGTDHRFYDNRVNREKFRWSELGEQLTRRLRAADRLNYVKQRRDKGFVNTKFRAVSKEINAAIVYADSHIKLSDVALCLSSTYNGRTYADCAKIVTREPGHPFAQALLRPDLFRKHMFELVYGLSAMNVHLNLIQGDLHMNNITIGEVFRIHEVGSLRDRARVVYAISNNAYMFPHIGSFSYIIDFSRAIIGDFRRLEYEFSPAFAEIYGVEQSTRILQYMYLSFPKIVETYHGVIRQLMSFNFATLFKAITCIDTFRMMTNLAALFGISEDWSTSTVPIAQESRELLRDIIKTAESLFVDIIKRMITGAITDASAFNWPNLDIIDTVFARDLLDQKNPPKNVVLTDVFNFDNTMTYDIEDDDMWGPLLSLDKEVEILTDAGEPHTNMYEIRRDHILRDESMRIGDMMKRWKKRVEPDLEFTPWMFK